MVFIHLQCFFYIKDNYIYNIIHHILHIIIIYNIFYILYYIIYNKDIDIKD
jgi:hypothetical protein